MANDLYKIELIAKIGNFDIADGVGMLYTNNGIAFVKLHPIKVKATPKTDAVEVVRCEECFWWDKAMVNKKGFLICPTSGMEISNYDYCSYGERKEK